MAKLLRENGAEFSPCILSQVRKALGLKEQLANNSKKCSNEYWNEAISKIASIHFISFKIYKTKFRKNQ